MNKYNEYINYMYKLKLKYNIYIFKRSLLSHSIPRNTVGSCGFRPAILRQGPGCQEACMEFQVCEVVCSVAVESLYLSGLFFPSLYKWGRKTLNRCFKSPFQLS